MLDKLVVKIANIFRIVGCDCSAFAVEEWPGALEPNGIFGKSS
jgi:hypothetical protein